MKKVIVTTTINSPTEAIERFDSFGDYELVVVGDRKTPADYKLKRGFYISPCDQSKRYPKLSSLLGWNCIQRRNLGFLIALEMGADIIATVDDDNIPDDDWGSDLLIGSCVTVSSYETDDLVFDPISVTNMPHLWHRGFPIQLVNERKYHQGPDQNINVNIQADFWNGDPDVDAICRMIYKPNCIFARDHFPFFSEQIAPFNSQNTFLERELLPNYFMFPFIGRMDDIWGSYYLQMISGCRPVFNRPTVNQARNEHDLTKDFEGEITGYSNTLKMLIDMSKDVNSLFSYLPERSSQAFLEYKTLAEKLV
ncbi:hypothetical protein N9W46_00110 [Litoricolaceae bacterium]|nr:hypothetical protein [Litorivicinaceae bacterium]